MDVGAYRFDQTVGSVLAEHADARDAGERGDDLRSLVLAVDRARRAFEPPHGIVAVDADQQRVAQIAGLLQVTHMPDMQDVE